MMRYALVLFMLSVLGFLGGCAKPRIDLAVASQLNSNPDHTGRPSPVIVKVYELRSDLAFSQSDFRPLFETPVQVLGADLLAADELVLVPGEARRITYEPVEGTRFLGLLAGFRQMERAKWKVVSSIDFERVNTVGIEIRDATLMLIPGEEALDWDPLQAVYKFHNPTGEDTAAMDEGVSAEPPASAVRESSSGRDGSALGDR
jgi:type VI secretion system protein VasD